MTRLYARTNDAGSGRRFARTNDTGTLIPTITTLNSNNQRTGDSITITGTNFNATKGAGSVTLDGVTCTTTSWGDTSIVYTVPAGMMFTGTKTLIVTVNSGQTVSRTGIVYLPATGYIFERINAVPVSADSLAYGITGLAVGDEVFCNATASKVGGGGTATVIFNGVNDGVVTLTGVTVSGDYTVSGINVRDLTDKTDTSNGPKTLVYDVTAPVGYAVNVVETTITDVTGNLINVNITGAEVGTTYNYSIQSSVIGTPITGTGSVATTSFSLTNIDTSSLPDGTLSFSFTLTDSVGLTGLPVADTCVKFTDRIPNQFTFNAQTNVALNTVITSNTITIVGMTNGYSAPAVVTNGEWQKNSGAWTTSAGTVTNGDTVAVRHNSSASIATTVSTLFDVNGVQNSLSSTTVSADVIPNAFSFTDVIDIALSTLTASNTVTISGINSASPVTVVNGEWRKNAGSYTTSAGTVVNGDTVQVRQTSSASYATITNTVLTIGGVSDTYSITTLNNTAPNAFSFADQTNVPQNTVIVSTPITILGITAAAVISVTGGEYSIDGGAFTNVTGTINNNQTVRVRHTSSTLVETVVSTILTVGGVSDTFTSTTTQADTTPDAFVFTAQTNVPLNTLIVSNTDTITGINVATAISIVNGEYSIDGALYTSATGVINAGQTVKVRQISASSYSTGTNTSLTIGGVSAIFTSTTLASIVDTTPDAFSFATQSDVTLNTIFISNSITVAGINAAAAISVANGEYSIDNGPFVSLASTILNGQTVRVRQTSSFNYSTTTTVNLTIGGVSGSFSVITLVNTTTPPDTTDEMSDEELIQFILDNNGNPPNTNFGIFSNALNVDSLLVNYIANSALPSALTDSVQLNKIHSKLLRHYIAGNALRGDNDTQNKTLGAEELALYEDEITKLNVPTVSHHIPEDELTTSYNPLG